MRVAGHIQFSTKEFFVHPHNLEAKAVSTCMAGGCQSTRFFTTSAFLCKTTAAPAKYICRHTGRSARAGLKNAASLPPACRYTDACAKYTDVSNLTAPACRQAGAFTKYQTDVRNVNDRHARANPLPDTPFFRTRVRQATILSAKPDSNYGEPAKAFWR